MVGWVHIGMVRSDLAPLLYDLLARLARLLISRSEKIFQKNFVILEQANGLFNLMWSKKTNFLSEQFHISSSTT